MYYIVMDSLLKNSLETNFATKKSNIFITLLGFLSTEEMARMVRFDS